MNKKQFLNRLIANWPTKIICFVIAILIYFFHQMSTLQHKTFIVPVSITANGKMVPASENNKFVKVTIRGKSEEIASISISDFKAYLDITSETKEGTNVYPVLVEPDSRLALVEPLEIKVSPEKLSLAIEERLIRYVPVAPTISGQYANGYEATQIVCIPTTIKVEGPRSMVESLSRIQTEEIPVDGLMQNKTQQVLPVNDNHLISLDMQTPVSVTINVTETRKTKSFSDIQVSYNGLPDTFEVTSPPVKVSFSVEGSALVVDKISADTVVVQADCSKIASAGKHTVPVSVEVENGVNVTEQSITSIVVTVVENKTIHSDKDSEESLQNQMPANVRPPVYVD